MGGRVVVFDSTAEYVSNFYAVHAASAAATLVFHRNSVFDLDAEALSDLSTALGVATAGELTVLLGGNAAQFAKWEGNMFGEEEEEAREDECVKTVTDAVDKIREILPVSGFVCAGEIVFAKTIYYFFASILQHEQPLQSL